MNEIVVLSGKGGTGKTVVASSLAAMADGVVLADADVDAANLELLLGAVLREEEPFVGGSIPVLDRDACDECGLCEESCRFDAIDGRGVIDRHACEGCGLCALVCPAHAIRMEPRVGGKVFVSDTAHGSLVHARLDPGEENSGKLVSRVRGKARDLAESKDRSFLILDGPPGIGCPAIASLGGADLALLVTEPGVTGMHDLDRVLDLAEHFRVRAAVVVNRCDLAPENTESIARRCEARGVAVLDGVPFDRAVVDAVTRGVPPALDGDGPGARALRAIWPAILKLID